MAIELQGIDVSHYQGKIDWIKVKEAGKRFAILKCQYEAQSHRKDETFEYNYEQAGINELCRGVYIYIARHSMEDPVADAKALLDHLKGRTLEYGIWLDLEDKNLRPAGKAYIKNLANLYSNIFKEAGYYVGIYCNHDWYINVIDTELKQNYDFWIARYRSFDNGVYNEFSSLKPKFRQAVAWQYSSKGKVPGISGNVDLDVDLDGIINLYAQGQPKEKKVTGNPYIMPNINIRKGMISTGVKWVQWMLKERGFDIEVDGIFGKKTEAAVKDFQLKFGLKEDGIVGKKTREALIGR